MDKNDLLNIQNISSGYGSTIIVNNFSFSVKIGQILAITGSNGMGKTTLMKTIMGLLDAREGKIFYKNNDITTRSSDFRSKLGIGYVPQGREIFSSLTEALNHIYLKFKVTEFTMNAATGTIQIDDGTEAPPEPPKTWDLYGEK